MAVALLLQLRRCATVPISLSRGSPAEPLRQELRRVPTNSTPATPSPAVDRSSAMACSSVGRRRLSSPGLSAAAPAVPRLPSRSSRWTAHFHPSGFPVRRCPEHCRRLMTPSTIGNSPTPSVVFCTTLLAIKE
ncbi:hypothetical protein ACP4OV_027691 [Aristida adscensionis]